MGTFQGFYKFGNIFGGLTATFLWTRIILALFLKVENIHIKFNLFVKFLKRIISESFNI